MAEKYYPAVIHIGSNTCICVYHGDTTVRTINCGHKGETTPALAISGINFTFDDAFIEGYYQEPVGTLTITFNRALTQAEANSFSSDYAVYISNSGGGYDEYYSSFSIGSGTSTKTTYTAYLYAVTDVSGPYTSVEIELGIYNPVDGYWTFSW